MWNRETQIKERKMGRDRWFSGWGWDWQWLVVVKQKKRSVVIDRLISLMGLIWFWFWFWFRFHMGLLGLIWFHMDFMGWWVLKYIYIFFHMVLISLISYWWLLFWFHYFDLHFLSVCWVLRTWRTCSSKKIMKRKRN